MFRTESTIATLAAPPPPHTVAVLVYDPDAPDLARGFVLLRDPAATTIEIFMSDRCKLAIPGTRPTRAGDQVSLAWLDATGHVSLLSSPLPVKPQ